MSYEGSKTNTDKKSNLSQKTKSGKDNKSKIKSRGKSIPDKIYENSTQNLKNMIELKKNLEKGNYAHDLQKDIAEFEKKNEEISKLYGDEENVKKSIRKDDNWKLNNDLFEERTLKILSDVYELKEYNLYPYFDVGFSKTKKSNVIKIYFNQIDLRVDNEEPTFSALFLDDLDTYMFYFQEMPMIIHKYEENFFTLTVISKDFKNSIDFDFKKGDNDEKIATTSFIFAELNEDLMEIKNKIKKLKNEIDSSNDKDKKKLYDKKLASYQKILKLKEYIYSQKNIENELTKKTKQLSILEEREKIREIEDEEEEIKKDYLLSNVYRKEILQDSLESVSSLSEDHPEIVELVTIMDGVLEKTYEIVMTSIKDKYGDAETYLLKEYGLDEDRLQVLRDRYLDRSL